MFLYDMASVYFTSKVIKKHGIVLRQKTFRLRALDLSEETLPLMYFGEAVQMYQERVYHCETVYKPIKALEWAWKATNLPTCLRLVPLAG